MQSLFVLAALFTAVGVMYGLSYVSYLPEFNIHSITVTGTKELPPRLIQAYVETLMNDGSNRLFSNTTILGFGLKGIEQKTEHYFLRTKDISITRQSLLANAISVNVVERMPYAQWCGSVGDCYILDETGFLFAPATTTSVTMEPYIFYGGLQGNPLGQQYVSAHFPGLVALLRLLGQAGFNAKTFKVDNEKDFSITFADGYSMRASFGQDARSLSQNLKLVMGADPLKGKASTLEYIDLRFGDRVYYKFRGLVESGTSTLAH